MWKEICKRKITYKAVSHKNNYAKLLIKILTNKTQYCNKLYITVNWIYLRSKRMLQHQNMCSNDVSHKHINWELNNWKVMKTYYLPFNSYPWLKKKYSEWSENRRKCPHPERTYEWIIYFLSPGKTSLPIFSSLYHCGLDLQIIYPYPLLNKLPPILPVRKSDWTEKGRRKRAIVFGYCYGSKWQNDARTQHFEQKIYNLCSSTTSWGCDVLINSEQTETVSNRAGTGAFSWISGLDHWQIQYGVSP